MSESKITATKVARLGVLVLAFLAALVAVQAFGAKPAEASLWPGGFFRLFDEPAPLVEPLEVPARLEAHGAALTDDEALREAEARAWWTDGGPGGQVTDTEVAKRKEALKSELEDTIEYVHDGGCVIAKVAAATGGPPTDDRVRSMVETDVPTKYLALESEEGSSGFATKNLRVEIEEGVYGYYLVVPRKQVKSELVEINHLVRRDMKVSYRNYEPDVGSDVASEILSGAIDAGCQMKDVIKSLRQ